MCIRDRKTAKAVVTYRFPCVVPTCTGTNSWGNYTTVRRVIELPVGRQSAKPRVEALVGSAS